MMMMIYTTIMTYGRYERTRTPVGQRPHRRELNSYMAQLFTLVIDQTLSLWICCEFHGLSFFCICCRVCCQTNPQQVE